MRIFVAGATGTLGRPVVAQLVDAGHEVIGMTRSAAKREALAAAGVEPVVADALDAQALRDVVVAAKPDVVLHLLTAIPAAGPMGARDLDATNKLRVEGTRNLLDAATAAGAGRFVAESYLLAYGFGDHGDAPRAEEALPPVRRGPGRDVVDALRTLEDEVTRFENDGRPAGVALRFGSFYGPGVPSMGAMVDTIRARKMPIIGAGTAKVPLVHIDDAAEATVATVTSPATGVVNVAGDQPVAYARFVSALARQAGVPEPRRVPRALGRLVAPFGTAFLTTNLVMDTRKAHDALGWAPRHPDALADVPALVAGTSQPASPAAVPAR